MQQGNATYRLIVRRGPQPNQVYEITKEVTNLGRDIINDIVINDREVSRQHLRITRGADTLSVEDLGSTNGTFINGKRLSGAVALKNGDMIGLGETVTLGFEIVRGSAAPPSPAASPYGSGAPAGEGTPPPQQAAPPPQPAPQPAPDNAPAQNPYQPPQGPGQGQPSQEEAYQPDPYAPSPYQPGQGYQQPADPYAPPQSPQPIPADAGYYPPAQGGYAPPQAPPNYDYDPYLRENEGGSSTRWLLIGCAVFFLLACGCVSVVGLVIIDQTNAWCTFPVVSDVVGALGFCGSASP